MHTELLLLDLVQLIFLSDMYACIDAKHHLLFYVVVQDPFYCVDYVGSHFGSYNVC